jgi:hypothetical protein
MMAAMLTPLDAPGRARLDAALVGLERAFGPRRDRIAPVHACTHCFDPEYLSTLAGPVAEIPDRIFSRAVSKWGTTMDSNVLLWRRLSPRILSQMAGQSLHIDETLLARKFGEARWQDWADEERLAIAEFCEGWFEAALTAADGPNAIDVLPFVAVMHQGVEHWLKVWSSTAGRRADEQLALLAAWWLPDLLNGDLDVSFSGDLPDISAEVTAWLLAEAPSRLVDGDLSADDTYRLSQLALPEAQRWR